MCRVLTSSKELVSGIKPDFGLNPEMFSFLLSLPANPLNERQVQPDRPLLGAVRNANPTVPAFLWE
jgi:hypothetical protein